MADAVDVRILIFKQKKICSNLITLANSELYTEAKGSFALLAI